MQEKLKEQEAKSNSQMSPAAQAELLGNEKEKGTFLPPPDFEVSKTLTGELSKNNGDITNNIPQLKRQENNPKTDNTNHSQPKKEGLPGDLKSGYEYLSGFSLDDVNVQYNSDKPSQLGAHAYAQGSDIHLASGQEKHLAHEAWHVVQQKQGRVKETSQINGVGVNAEENLENEADQMVNKVETTPKAQIDLTKTNQEKSKTSINASSPVQRVPNYDGGGGSGSNDLDTQEDSVREEDIDIDQLIDQTARAATELLMIKQSGLDPKSEAIDGESTRRKIRKELQKRRGEIQKSRVYKSKKAKPLHPTKNKADNAATAGDMANSTTGVINAAAEIGAKVASATGGLAVVLSVKDIAFGIKNRMRGKQQVARLQEVKGKLSETEDSEDHKTMSNVVGYTIDQKSQKQKNAIESVVVGKANLGLGVAGLALSGPAAIGIGSLAILVGAGAIGHKLIHRIRKRNSWNKALLKCLQSSFLKGDDEARVALGNFLSDDLINDFISIKSNLVAGNQNAAIEEFHKSVLKKIQSERDLVANKLLELLKNLQDGDVQIMEEYLSSIGISYQTLMDMINNDNEKGALKLLKKKLRS